VYCSSLFRKIAKPEEEDQQQMMQQQQIQQGQQIDEDQQVVLIREMESFTETLLVTSAKLDCVRLSKTKILKALDERSDKNELKCCIFPLFNWCVYFNHLMIIDISIILTIKYYDNVNRFHLSDHTFEKFDCKKFTNEVEIENE
jgi:hypothetical protein